MMATVREDSVRILDMGTMPARATGTERAGTGPRAEAKREYMRHLTRTFVIAEITMFASSIMLWFVASDLWAFTKAGESSLHPVLGIFIMIATLSLITIASISIFTTISYVRKVVGEA